jgi:hypothetical protein
MNKIKKEMILYKLTLDEEEMKLISKIKDKIDYYKEVRKDIKSIIISDSLSERIDTLFGYEIKVGHFPIVYFGIKLQKEIQYFNHEKNLMVLTIPI